MARPESRLKNNPYNKPTYTYPVDLGAEGQEPYIIFDVRSSVVNGAKSKETIGLYMPPNIKVGYNAQWQDVELGGDKAKALLDAVNSNGMWSTLGNDLRNGAIGALSGLAGSTNSRLETGLITNKIMNPHAALLFSGVGFRQFQFDFQMMARNEQESENIRQIIYKFKYYSLPGMGGGGDIGTRYLFYPENFIIGLFTPADKQMFYISTCALTDVDVNYTGSGGNGPVFFAKTGASVNVQLSLRFKELEIMTKERIREGY